MSEKERLTIDLKHDWVAELDGYAREDSSTITNQIRQAVKFYLLVKREDVELFITENGDTKQVRII